MSDEYEVESIIGHRFYRGKKQYKIHWKGYSHSDDTWENEANIHAPILIKEYEDKLSKPPTESSKKSKNKSKPIKKDSEIKEKKTRGPKRKINEVVGISIQDGKYFVNVVRSDKSTDTIPYQKAKKQCPLCLCIFFENYFDQKSQNVSSKQKKERKQNLPHQPSDKSATKPSKVSTENP